MNHYNNTYVHLGGVSTPKKGLKKKEAANESSAAYETSTMPHSLFKSKPWLWFNELKASHRSRFS
uniref:Uncharacterized protein n=1 Tax=Glossina pallidipes TaxID=7398 RepID=A0A1B0A0C7_GLOPL